MQLYRVITIIITLLSFLPPTLQYICRYILKFMHLPQYWESEAEKHLTGKPKAHYFQPYIKYVSTTLAKYTRETRFDSFPFPFSLTHNHLPTFSSIYTLLYLFLCNTTNIGSYKIRMISLETPKLTLSNHVLTL